MDVKVGKFSFSVVKEGGDVLVRDGAVCNKVAYGRAFLHKGEPFFPAIAEKLADIVAGVKRCHIFVRYFKGCNPVCEAQNEIVEIFLERQIFRPQKRSFLHIRDTAATKQTGISLIRRKMPL